MWAGIQHFSQGNAPCSLSPLERGLKGTKSSLGLVLLLSLMLWRLMERQMRAHVETTEPLLIGLDKKPTALPTAFMMASKFAGLLVLKSGRHRQLARPLSAVQQQYLTALGLVSSCFIVPSG